MARKGVRLTHNGVKMSRKRLPEVSARRREMMEEVNRLRLDGRTIKEITAIIGRSTRTVDRLLAEIRSRRKAVTSDPNLRWDLAKSVDEKARVMGYVRKIVTRPERYDSEGRLIDDSKLRIAAATVVAKVSDSLDRLFGLDHVELRKNVEETRRLWESEKESESILRELRRQREERLRSRAKPLDIVEWTEANRILNGRPFSFKDRDYLLPIYRDTSHRILIVKARQMEMTEFIVNWLLYNVLTHPGTVGIYTAPRMDQVKRFSQDRFRRAVNDSPTLRENLEAAREEQGKESLSSMAFNNGSVCYFVSAWDQFNAIRGIPADFVAVDEFQDMNAEALPVIKESMSHSKHNRLLIVGTASESGSEFERLCLSSDMKEWDKERKAWIPRQQAQETGNVRN